VVGGVFSVKVYGISSSSMSGGSDSAERRQLEQKVMLANSVAQSFTSPDNERSRGQRMFLARRQNSERWTTAGPDPPLSSPPPGPDEEAARRPPPQRAPAGRPHAIAQPALAAAARPRHHAMSGPRPARSFSAEGGHQGGFGPRMAVPGPHQYGPAAADQYLQRQVPRPAPQPPGYLRPAMPPGGPPGGPSGAPMGGPESQVRTRSDSFGSLQSALRTGPADWQLPMATHQHQQQQHQHQMGVVERWSGGRLSGGDQYHHQHPHHWPSSPASQPQRQAASGHYGVSDL